MFLFKRPVVQLPKVTAPSAADLAAKAKVQPTSQAMLKPGMSSSEYIHTLEENRQSVDAVNALAHGMPERESVHWACQSSRKVANKLNAEDSAALAAAEAWVKTPDNATKAAAAAAASKTDFTGPGGWAAQAAAWSQGTPGMALATPQAGQTASAVAATPPAGLTAPAVAGAVLLAAGLVNRQPMPPAQKLAMPQMPTVAAPGIVLPQVAPPAGAPPAPPPVDQAKLAKPLQPFIDLGKDIASGKNRWA